jgi:hypothetical protein
VGAHARLSLESGSGGFFIIFFLFRMQVEFVEEDVRGGRDVEKDAGLKAYFWWIESVLATGTDHTSSNIISRDWQNRNEC